MRSRTEWRTSHAAALAVALWCAIGAARAIASMPSVADLDAASRAVGNRRAIAVRVGESVFDSTLPAQVSQISANAVGDHVIVGVRMWGVKFHQPLTRAQFVAEVSTVVERVFAAAPSVEEVDVWASVPIAVRKGEIVSGDLAQPTTKTVFTLVARAGENAHQVTAAAYGSPNVYWNEAWERSAFRAAGDARVP